MKKTNFFRILMALIFVIFAAGELRPQAQVQVGTGTEAAGYLVYYYAYRTYTQTIYMADLLPDEMEIIQIAYEYVGDKTYGKRIKIWFSTTTEDEIDRKYVTTETNRQLVFEGTFNKVAPTAGQSNWLPIVLQTPYNYEGGNLVITMSSCDANWNGNLDFRVSSSTKFVTTNTWNDGSTTAFIEPPVGTTNGSFQTYPNIRFTYTPTDAPILAITPKELNYGTQLANTTETRTVSVKNSGVGTLTVSGINVSNPAFTHNVTTFPITLNAGQSQDIIFSFLPTAPNNYSATAAFAITETEYYGDTVLTLSGTATLPAFSMNPSAVAFPIQMTNTTQTRTVTISNTSIGTLNVTGVTVSNPAFTHDATFPIALNAGGSSVIEFQFLPPTEGDYSATATFAITETDYTGSNVLNLSGKALDNLPILNVDFEGLVNDVYPAGWVNSLGVFSATTFARWGSADLTDSRIIGYLTGAETGTHTIAARSGNFVGMMRNNTTSAVARNAWKVSP
jgi:hypothetical protein